MYVGILYLVPEHISPERVYQQLSDAEPAATGWEIKTALEERGHSTELVLLNNTPFEQLKKYDWLFNLTENVFGFPLNESDIALKLEELAIPFTGAGSQALRLCGDKPLAKAELVRLGIPTPGYEVFHPDQKIDTNLQFPLFVKPAYEDASIGIQHDSVVYHPSDMVRKVNEIFQQFEEPALVEEYIDGRDIEISILGNGNTLKVLPPYECVYLDTYIGPKILTFETKWDANSLAYQNTEAVCPAKLTDNQLCQAMEISSKVFRALGCRDYARIDFRLRDQELYVLDVNPNPCISETDSGFTVSGKAAGYSYPALVEEILKQSFLNQRFIRPSLFKPDQFAYLNT